MKVFWYVPNVVDYVRYLLVMYGMLYAFVEERWMTFIFYYYVAIFLDVIDGALARMFDQ